MKNKISVLLFALIAAFTFTGCDEDEVEPFNDPTRLIIGGRSNVSPGVTHAYTVGNVANPDSYTWSVDGPAQIVGSATGNTVRIEFQSVGDVEVTVTNGSDTGRLDVEVGDVEPSVTATLNGTGVLRRGESDTVFFEFDAPVSEIESFGFNTEDSTGFNRGGTPFVSGSLGDLVRVDDRNYYAIYTAGTGNGTSEVKFSNITSTAAYGSVNIDEAYAQLYRVDNIAPVATLSYSAQRANEGSVVTVTATFSEPVMPSSPSDSLLFVTLTGVGESEVDTLEATDNPRVYSFQYEVGEGDSQLDVIFENIVDYAGNELAGVNSSTEFFIDNTNPEVTSFSATDAGSSASITLSSNETGTGMYLILSSGASAPANAEEFMAASGVRSLPLTAGRARTVAEALASGSYNVYFMTVDAAGNYSERQSTSLIMD